MKECGGTLNFGCFLDLAFDQDLAEEEREGKERATEEEFEDGAFSEGISVGTKSAVGMKAKDLLLHHY